MNKFTKIFGLAISLLIAGIIVFFLIKPELLFKVTLTIDYKKDIRFSTTSWVVKPDSDGVVNFNMMGTLGNLSSPKIKMEISPDEENKWYLQGIGYRVIDSAFIGKAQLGSKEWPMKKDQHYSFRLISDNGQLLAQGEIDARVHKTYGTESTILIFVTLLASIVQIITFLLL